MKPLLKFCGVLLVLVGVVWILQGVDILPGSFMTGEVEWAIYGALSVILGLTVLRATRSRRTGSGS